MKSIVLASSNLGKVREFSQILNTFEVEIIPQSQFEVPTVEETGLSFVENALIKARHASQYTGLPALADDSGIEVDALQGDPGIYSARFAGPNASDEENNVLLLAKLKGVPDAQRLARYHCIIVYMRYAHDSMPIVCSGTWEGSILHEPRGQYGFGYDPLFYVPTHHCSAAELSPEVKNQLSHRGQALRALQICLKMSVG
jgi:XTP/dITP diphosphohydrolase